MLFGKTFWAVLSVMNVFTLVANAASGDFGWAVVSFIALVFSVYNYNYSIVKEG